MHGRHGEHTTRKALGRQCCRLSIQMPSLSQLLDLDPDVVLFAGSKWFKPEIPSRHESHVLRLNGVFFFFASELWTNCKVSSRHKNVDPKTQNYDHLGLFEVFCNHLRFFFPSLLCGLHIFAGCNLYSLDRKTENDRVLRKPLCLSHG